MKINPPITIVMAYYENPTMLALHLEEWEAYPDEYRARMRAIIVDDGSPRSPAADVFKAAGYKTEHRLGAGLPLPFPVNLFRVVPNIPWNQDGARNLGMRKLRTEWALLTDMDHVLRHEQLPGLFGLDVEPRLYYMPNRCETNGLAVHPHPNSYLMRHGDFWEMGGYDEDFAGSYGSDGNFRRCARGAGLVERGTSAFHLTVYRTEDCFDANTKDFERKGSKYHVGNIPHLRAKARGPLYKATNPIRFEWEQVF